MDKNKKNESKDVKKFFLSAVKNVTIGIGEGVNKTVNGISSTAKSTAKNMADNSKKKEIDKNIVEHEYNIGRYVYDNDLEIDDAKIISNINAIDRLVEEINKLEGNTNG